MCVVRRGFGEDFAVAALVISFHTVRMLYGSFAQVRCVCVSVNMADCRIWSCVHEACSHPFMLQIATCGDGSGLEKWQAGSNRPS